MTMCGLQMCKYADVQMREPKYADEKMWGD